MKKVLILAALVAFTGSVVMAEEVKEPTKCPEGVVKLHKVPPKKIDFDKKLKLTEEQKAQANHNNQVLRFSFAFLFVNTNKNIRNPRNYS